MNYVSIVCDLIQIVCWFCVLHCFIRLFRERRKLLEDNTIMFKALTDIACMKVPEHSIFYNTENYEKYASTIYELGNIIDEMQSEASDVIESMVEEVKE